ncbi:UpxY family transcription antiterminator [Spirosoma fluviale]|uniref:Transcription antitermination factor NusG n=1 Tax=Spirosoma fluviale TaxID=1597977 RepID=A0A286GW74_9BACT|nr:UpxY family transcription antiterminator [Spirosoma fluviale]SOD99807.1 Transcription antitermination factor NusG [Spirosoma fluviale]
MNWYILCTKSRKEKSVSKYLEKVGIEAYCPVIRRQHKWSDRIKVVEEPLFANYCFVKVNETDRSKVFVNSGIIKYLYWLGKPAILAESEIDSIKSVLSQYDHSKITVNDFQSNDKIAIKSGAFINQTGTVLQRQGNNIVIYMEAIQMCIKINFNTTSVSKL